MLRKLPIVTVIGSGSAISPPRAKLARETGAMIARLGAHLLTGGGFGVMEAAASGFVTVRGRKGFSIGIVPRDRNGPLDRPKLDTTTRRFYPNDYVEIAIMTPLPSDPGKWRSAPTRNHINILTADAVVALPGSKGTENELHMAATYRGQHEAAPAMRRTILFDPDEEFSQTFRKAFLRGTTLDDVRHHVVRILRAGKPQRRSR